MITEVNSICSDKQALSTTAGTTVSTNTLDWVYQEPVYDGTLHFIAVCTNTTTGGTSLQVKLQTSANNSDWVDVVDTGAVAVASFPKDGVFIDKVVTDDFKGKRYWRFAYITVGADAAAFTVAPVMTAGLFTEAAPHYKKSFA